MKKDNIDSNSLAHTKWNCKYHIVFAPILVQGILRRYRGEKHESYKRIYSGAAQERSRE